MENDRADPDYDVEAEADNVPDRYIISAAVSGYSPEFELSGSLQWVLTRL
jgi:hypothetical protein